MRRTGISSSSDLFDLPLLVDPPGTEPEVSEPKPSPPEPEASPLAPAQTRPPKQELEPPAEQIELPAEDAGPVESTETSTLRPRLVAGAIDTGATGAALAILAGGATALGAAPELSHWPAYLLLSLQTSFLYMVFSLSFWGATPGMSRAGLHAQADDGGPITLGQAVRRWLGGVVTVALFGLPTLLVLRRQSSLADLLSRSRLTA